VRAWCERTVVERCQVTFGKTPEYALVMPMLLVGVRWGRAIGWVCKSEAAGSNPARSISRKPVGCTNSISLQNSRIGQTAEFVHPRRRGSDFRALHARLGSSATGAAAAPLLPPIDVVAIHRPELERPGDEDGV
jgi:hypothetical protein